jgi:flagellar M-ring protein FliF
LLDLLKTAAAPLALSVVALVLVFSLIRPAVRQMLAPPPAPEPGSGLNEVVDDGANLSALEGGALPQLAAPANNDRLEAARNLAKQNPAAVANIVRGWVSGEA